MRTAIGHGVAAAAVAGALLAVLPAAAMPVQWTIAAGGNDHWYELVLDTGKGWNAAKQAAEGSGGYLVTILSAEEQGFILNEFFSVGSGYGSYWIGLSDAATEGAFVWVTGESLGYTNWGDGQPDNNESFAGGPEDWVQLVWRSDGSAPYAGKWNDAPEQGFFGRTDFPHLNRQGYIVEYDTAVVPVPAALPLFATALAGLGLLARRRRRARAGG